MQNHVRSLVQDLSRGKAALVTERAQAEEELGKVRAQVRLEEVRCTLCIVTTAAPAALLMEAARFSAAAAPEQPGGETASASSVSR